MTVEDALLADCPYGPEGFFVDDVIEVDKEASRVQVRVPTPADLPLTRAQRVHPLHHPAHINGGLLVHLCGVVAYVHFYYVFGLRHADGWVGYATRIHNARFLALAPPGPPLLISCTCTQARRGDSRILARYDCQYMQLDKTVFRCDLSALWMRTSEQGVTTER